MRVLAGVLVMVMCAGAAPSWAGDLKCVGERIEKGSSTWGYARTTGSDYRIEKGSSTIGYAKKRNDSYAVEVSSSTIGWLKGDRIEKSNGSTWTRLSEAQSFARECPDAVAAALWVMNESGKL